MSKDIECMSQEWCLAPDRGLPRPDLTIYLQQPERQHTSTSALSEREGFGEERYEKVEMQKRVANVFEQVCKSGGHVAGTNLGPWQAVDAYLSIDAVHELIMVKVRSVEINDVLESV